MVIGSPNINDMINTLELVPVVSHIGSKIRVFTVRLYKYAVLIVTKFC